jgi:hypothetical protein
MELVTSFEPGLDELGYFRVFVLEIIDGGRWVLLWIEMRVLFSCSS